MTHARALALCLLTMAALRSAAADNQYSIRHWGVEEGMPHNTANGVVQSDDGFLWVATDAGLSRFDGLTFRRENSPLFVDAKSATIRSIIRKDAHTFLVANGKADLLQVEGDDVSRYPLTLPSEAYRSVRSLFRESDAAFWISFLDGEVWRCTAAGAQKFPASLHSVKAVATFAVGPDGSVYVSRGAGVERFDGGQLVTAFGGASPATAVGSAGRRGVWVVQGGRLRLTDGNTLRAGMDPGISPELIPEVLLESRDGTVWVGLANYSLLHWTQGGVATVETFHSRINGLFEDSEGSLWVATEGGGLNRLRPLRFDVLPNASDAPLEAASSVCEDSAGDVWFASHSSLKRSHNGTISTLSPAQGWPNNASWLSPDKFGNVWIGEGRTVWRARVGSDEPPVRVEAGLTSNLRAMYSGADGAEWLASESGPMIRLSGGGVDRYGPEQGYSGSKAQAMAEDPDGTLWVGTGAGELFSFARGAFGRVDVSAATHGNGLRAIVADSDGWMWIGTDGDGVLARHGATTVRIDHDRGLPDDVISQIVEDDYGFVWFGSRRGLFKLRREDLIECATGARATITPITYGRDDGLSGISVVGGHQPSVWKTRAGSLWFTTRAGFVTTTPAPESFERVSLRPVMDAVLADGAPLPGDRRIRSSARRVEFRYAAPTFISPESERFRYRLEGVDPDWSEPTAQRQAVYSELPAGKYRFQVEVSDGQGSWSEEAAEESFVVVPVWWESLWMRVSDVVVGGLVIALIVRHLSLRRLKRRLAKLEQDQRVAKERERIARNLHDGLGAGLTHVGMMAEQLVEDSHEAADMRRRAILIVDRVQSVARDLDAAVWAISPRHDRLPALCAYLCEYAIEFFRETEVRCRVELGDDIPDVTISPEVRHNLFFAAKEALNNVLKHAGAAEVTLRMGRRDAVCLIEIVDDGCGFDVAAADRSARNGLRNLRERINETGGQLAVLSSPRGTTVRILIPCQSL